MDLNTNRLPYSGRRPEPDLDPLAILVQRRLEIRDRRARSYFYGACFFILAVVPDTCWPDSITDLFVRLFSQETLAYLHCAQLVTSLLSLWLAYHNFKGTTGEPQLLDLRLTRDQRKLLGLNPDVLCAADARDCRPVKIPDHPHFAPPGRTNFFRTPAWMKFLSNLKPHHPPVPSDKPQKSCNLPLMHKSVDSAESEQLAYSQKPACWTEEDFQWAKKPNRRFKILWNKLTKSAPLEPINNIRLLNDMLDYQLQYSTTGTQKKLEESGRFYPMQPYRVAPPPFDYQLDNPWRGYPTVNGLPLFDEWQALEQENLQAEDVFSWSENTREWLANFVFINIAQMIAQIDEQLANNGMGHLTTKNCTNTTRSSIIADFNTIIETQKANPGYELEKPAASGLSLQSAQAPQSLEDLVRRYPKWVVTVDRLRLELYLSMPGYECVRDYIVSRIQTLADAHRLSPYNYNGGSSQWNYKKFPSDPEIVMHIFCSFLDLTMPIANPGERPFTSNYFVGIEGKVNPNKGVQIKQARKAKHGGVVYILIAGSFCYDIRPGTYNIFRAISLFTWYIMKHYHGYLGALHLNGKTVNMRQIFEKTSQPG